MSELIGYTTNVPACLHHAGGVGLNHPSVHPYGVYETASGTRILIAIQNEREFAAFCRDVLQQPELPEDARFNNNVSRCANRAALDGIIQASFGAATDSSLVDSLESANIVSTCAHTECREWVFS